MLKAVPTPPATKLVLPESLAAALDQMVARMNTPADRAARAAFFAASSADLGRAAMNARRRVSQSKSSSATPPKY